MDPDVVRRRKEACAKGGAASGPGRRAQTKALADKAKLLSVEGVAAYTAEVIADTRSGQISPVMSRSLIYALSLQVRALEVSDLEARVAALEQKAQGVKGE